MCGCDAGPPSTHRPDRALTGIRPVQALVFTLFSIGLPGPPAARPALAARPCEAPPWRELHAVLREASERQERHQSFLALPTKLSRMLDPLALKSGLSAWPFFGLLGELYLIWQHRRADWFKRNYEDCVEGMLAFALYCARVNAERRQSFLALATELSRMLNPLALKSGLSAWPFFGLLGELHLVWQDGARAAPLPTEPWRLASCAEPPPAVVSPLLAALAPRQRPLGALQLARSLRPGALLVDGGVFDGTDWSLEGVLAGATVLGFEPLPTNHRLFEERFPASLAAELPARGAAPPAASAASAAGGCRRHTMLSVVPGEAAPQRAWVEVFPPGGETGEAACAAPAPAPNDVRGAGHVYVLGAALGERVRALNMTTRYDYTSVADQGYLRGPPDMRPERVAMVTLDHIFGAYLQGQDQRVSWSGIDVLKLDVEGYEMGALRGAERLLAEGRVHYVVLEFHPGMLGSTGTDPRGLLEFLRHYCFLCHSFRIEQPHDFTEFVERHTSSVDMLPMQGIGAIEDLVCQHLWWRPPPPQPAVAAPAAGGGAGWPPAEWPYPPPQAVPPAAAP